jgi:hypothetical protein
VSPIRLGLVKTLTSQLLFKPFFCLGCSWHLLVPSDR